MKNVVDFYFIFIKCYFFSKILNLIKPVKKIKTSRGYKKWKPQRHPNTGNHEINYTMAKRRIDDDPDKNI